MKINKKTVLAIGGALVALGGVLSVGKQHMERKEKLDRTRKEIDRVFAKKHAKKGLKIISVYRHGKKANSKKKDKDITLSLSK